MLRWLIFNPVVWLLVFLTAVVACYFMLVRLIGWAGGVWRGVMHHAQRGPVRRQFADADLSWALDGEPAANDAVTVRWRTKRDGGLREQTVPVDWLPRGAPWKAVGSAAARERERVARLGTEWLGQWREMRRLGWQVIRAAEALEQKGMETLPGTQNRAGILKWLDAGLGGLEYLSGVAGWSERLRHLRAEVRQWEARVAALAPDDPTRVSTEATLETERKREAELERRMAQVAGVRSDLDCLLASLRLAAEQMESAVLPVPPGRMPLFSARDTPLVALDLPLLEKLRQPPKAESL